MYIWFISCKVVSCRFDSEGVSELLFYVTRNVKIHCRPYLSHITGNSTRLEGTEDKRREPYTTHHLKHRILMLLFFHQVCTDS
uniref:Uncharacterized protein n=1 Tax=Hordeum vulgare subsp. vulgare TaxID=112509 RepID=A0A8I6XFR8_HORVV